MWTSASLDVNGLPRPGYLKQDDALRASALMCRTMSRCIPRRVYLRALSSPYSISCRNGLSGAGASILEAIASARYRPFSSACSANPDSGKASPAFRRPQAGKRPVVAGCTASSNQSDMTSKASHYSTAPASASKDKKQQPMEPRPSSSIVLLSPTNQVLLLRRVKTSSSFASAHVFPGGNLSEFHDGTVPPPGDPTRHQDSLAYRLGAIREAFEESGILLARDVNSSTGALLKLPAAERDSARKKIYNNEIKFGEWLESVGGVADTGTRVSMPTIPTLTSHLP